MPFGASDRTEGCMKEKIIVDRHWMIWPTGATEWMLTHSEKLAKRAKRKGWGCIEYRAVPDELRNLANDIVDGVLS